MPPLTLLIKPASGACNLRCRYCFYYDITTKREQASYGMMSDSTLETLVEKALRFAEGSCTFAFQGGEPTLCGLSFYEKLITLEDQYNVNDVQIQNTLQTNGILIDDAWAEFFHRNHFLIGLSLDGIRPSNDRYRVDTDGNGTFDRIMHTAALLRKHQVDFNILTVVHRDTALKAKKIYQFYKKNNFRYLQFIACLDPLYETPGAREYSLLPKDYGTFLCDLFDLWYDDISRGEQPYIRQFENYLQILIGQYPESCEQRGVCSYQHVVEADGEVYPCDFYVTDEYRLGSLLTLSIKEIEENRKTLGFVEASLNHPEKCSSCPYFALCRGGCRRHRMMRDDHLNYFCESYEMFFRHALPRLSHLARYLPRQ